MHNLANDPKPEKKRPEKLPLFVRLYISASSGIGSTMLSHPFDLVKSRMQVAGPGGGQVYRNWIHCMQDAVKDSYFHLYKGFGASCIRQITYTGTRISIYTYLNEWYRESQHLEPSVYMNMMMGLIAGACGAFVGTPADVALVRMTTDATLPPDHQRNYKNAIDAIKRIAKEEGIPRLWRGCWPTVVRAMVISMTQFAAYSSFKRTIKDKLQLEEGYLLQILAGFSSGIVLTTASLPVDIAKTRLQNMKIIDGKPQYKGTFDVLAKLLRNEGVLSLWKGYVPYLIRIVPGTMAMLLITETQMKWYSKYILGVDKGSKSSF